ncbi:hypothetical protein V9T40_005470 [Parthenolecanium corni]|uniref:Cytochrome P450 n=1 Tax=Parthenolecanium corni TaxID=536013 RepID=A0AAN9TGW8_9HEMI
MINFIIVLVATALCFILKYQWQNRRLVKMMNAFDGPPALPVVGNALTFVCSTKEILRRGLSIMAQYKNPIRIWLFHIPYVAITDPEDFQIVSMKALEKDDGYRFLADLIGDGLITAKVSKWKKNRKIIAPIFSRIILYHHYLDIFNKQSLKLVETLEQEISHGKQFDAWLYIFKTFFNIISETAMGYSKDFDNMETLAKLKDSTTKASLLAGQRFYQPWLQPSIIFKIYTFMKGWSNVFEESKAVPLKILKLKREKFLEEKSNNVTKEEKSYNSFIDILMNTHEAKHFTDEDVADEVLTIMFAATETSALITSFALLMLAMHPQIQEKVYEELRETFENSDRPMTTDEINKLTFLDQCIKETLRLFAAVPVVIRHTYEDLPISNGRVIPAGANIILAIFGVHQNENLYPNPKVWNPYNFDADKVAARHPCAFVPFGVGPRMCIGYKQSMVAITTLLATVLRKFKLSTDETEYELDVDFLIRSARGFNIRLEHRN